MNTRLSYCLCLILLCAFSAHSEPACNRIVSLAPSITEVLFSIGLGKHVVGVTKFDHFPKEVEQISRIGGFLDLNTELVVALRPDLIILLKEQTAFAERFNQLGLSTLVVEHRHVDAILQSLTTIANKCGVEDAAIGKRAQLEQAILQIKEKVAGLKRPRVAAIASRELGAGGIRAAFLSGNDGFYADLIEIAGGEVAYQGATVSLPGISLEGLIALKPDIILDIVPEFTHQGVTLADLKHDWVEVQNSTSLRQARIVFLSDDFAQIPGPRFDQLLLLIARALHPEKFSE